MTLVFQESLLEQELQDMADPLSITASIIAVAGAGARLATTLYTYSDTAFRADKSLKSIAQDVSLTSAVINELGGVLKEDDGPALCSDNAVRTARDVSPYVLHILLSEEPRS